MEKLRRIGLVVYTDAVKVEVDSGFGMKSIGWFLDEPAALCAACEHLLIHSAIMPQLRRLPALQVSTEYRIMKSGHAPQPYARATTIHPHETGRRVVLLPASSAKAWVCERAA